MPHLNKVILLGNLTREPELRATPKGLSVTQFGLAVNRTFKTEEGENREETTFVDLEAWGRVAELVARYLSKGSSCLIEGRLKLDTWEDKVSGEKRSRLRVVAENVQFLDRKAAEPEAPAARPVALATAPGQPPRQRRPRAPEPALAAR